MLLFVFSVPLCDLRHEVQTWRAQEVRSSLTEGALDRRDAKLHQVWQDRIHESHALSCAQEQLQGRKTLREMLFNNIRMYMYMYMFHCCTRLYGVKKARLMRKFQ